MQIYIQLNNVEGNKFADLCAMKGGRQNPNAIWHGIVIEYCASWTDKNRTELMVTAHLMTSYSLKRFSKNGQIYAFMSYYMNFGVSLSLSIGLVYRSIGIIGT